MTSKKQNKAPAKAIRTDAKPQGKPVSHPAPAANAKSTVDDIDLQIPMNKTSPLVWIAAVLGVALVAGVLFFVFGRTKEQPSVDTASAVHSAQLAAQEEKAHQQERIEHLQQAAKAWEMASEEEKKKKAEKAQNAEKEEDKAAGVAQGQGASQPSRRGAKSGARASDLDQLDKLGSEVNSQLSK